MGLCTLHNIKNHCRKQKNEQQPFWEGKGGGREGGVKIRDYIINLQLASTGLPTKDDNSKTTFKADHLIQP